ncbi:MAG TPA: POTRA domain-containing protein, partial [Flavitalea sp.]|nr:POTRA domain-containing protein [Flavitalea sp.]
MLRKFTPLFLLTFLLISGSLLAQQKTDTVPAATDPELINLTTSTVPKEYTITAIKISGTRYLDEQLLLSIAAINPGDKVVIPGGDQFSKAINHLWEQNLFENIQIFFTKLEGTNLSIEINVTEMPRLGNYFFKGVRKSEGEELTPKSGLVKGRVVTENVKRNAIEAIQKYYTEKGFQSASVRIVEEKDPKLANSVNLLFFIEKGGKVRINQVNFYGNETVSELKLKKKMKGTKE